MRNALIYIMMLFCSLSLSAQGTDTLDVQEADTVQVLPKGRMIPVKGAFLQQLQERDSVLVADQLLYGFELKEVLEGTMLALPELPEKQDYRLMFLSPWKVDTTKVTKQGKDQPRLMDIKGSVVISSFEEGMYELPQIMVGRMTSDGVLDTLVFDPMRLEVKTMPVDTATFQLHDIKGQIKYPITFKEVLPWVGVVLGILGVIALIVWLVIRYSKKRGAEAEKKEPAHIVAFRKLDKYKGNKMWAPEKQKAFYSGVTDALREYIDARYDIGAMEMTTAEIMKELKKTDISEELQIGLKELFERADYVKFAKYIASDEENAAALPLAVRFVASTYQMEVEEGSFAGAQDDKKGGE